MTTPMISLESASALVNRVAQRMYNVGDLECSLCYGKGFITYQDDDACEVVTCDCKAKR